MFFWGGGGCCLFGFFKVEEYNARLHLVFKEYLSLRETMSVLYAYAVLVDCVC